ncbi:MAG: hypothetical protein JNK04_23015 [Myxococcales bacterium]|nr:hypothetical protein [Myxococcales bacterium]
MRIQLNQVIALTLAIGAAGAFVGCEEAVDEVTNNVRCDDICEYAVDCDLIGGSIDSCQNQCEAAGDASQTVEDRIEDCASCLDHNDRTCEENDQLCAAECDLVPPLSE